MLLVSDVLAVPKSLLGILDAPSTPYWSDAELISYLNAFMFDACGRRMDLFAIREYVDLDPGVDQQIPAGGLKFLEAYFAGNGQAVFIKKMSDVLHSKFSNAAGTTAVTNVQVACADPRDRKRYHVFPPSDGTSGSTLEILFGSVPDSVSATTDAYPLDVDTVDAACNFIIAKAFDKNCERRDTVKSAAYRAAYESWVTQELQLQVGASPQVN